jgi:pyruvate-formate lyase-activating enzyme
MAEAAQEPSAIWDRFPSHERMAINFTLTCNLACAHCIVESSPHRRERLTLDEVRAALSEGAKHGKKHVTFSGGEVFLYPRDMCAAVASACELGYVADVESNAFWARSEAMARDRLAPFVEAGISGLSLSADAYHSRYFPVQRVINAARAGRSYGLLTEINFCPSPDLATDREIEEALAAAGEPYLRNELLDRGRGSDLSVPARLRRPDELPACDSLTTTIHATGDVYACCEVDISVDAMKRTPVFLGSIRTGAAPEAGRGAAERIVTAFYDPDSPVFFQRMVRDHPAFQPLADERFSNICDFCLRALGDPARVQALAAQLPDHA